MAIKDEVSVHVKGLMTGVGCILGLPVAIVFGIAGAAAVMGNIIQVMPLITGAGLLNRHPDDEKKVAIAFVLVGLFGVYAFVTKRKIALLPFGCAALFFMFVGLDFWFQR